MIKNDIRRVQFSGGSFMLSLPKDWCDANGVGEKTAMRTTECPHGILITKVE